MAEFLKNIYRYIRYKDFRRKLSREKSILPKQKKLIQQDYNQDALKIIVFIVPGADKITGKETMSGGVISILSIAAETKKIFEKNIETAVVVCTHTKDYKLLRYENIENNFTIYGFEQVAEYFKKVQEIIIHTPDYLTSFFFKNLSKKELQFLSHNVHWNIMNQNIKLMPTVDEVRLIKDKFAFTTITTAHQQYSTQYYRDYYGVPLHKFSTWVSPEQYKFLERNEKENLLVYSPDNHPQKQEVIDRLSKISGLKIQEIKGLTYTQFKDLISKAKWSLTFGEGLDGYFVEPIFSGSISFAVYNKEFFTEAFTSCKTVYSSYTEMCNKIASDINEIDNDDAFKSNQQLLFTICADLYSNSTYKKNIEKFYNQEFTFS